MKCTIPEISWHNRDPVLSIDIQPCTHFKDAEYHRLATGGTDSHVLIWYVKTLETGCTAVEIAADLTRHEKAVNVVRWSPSGEFLASGDDESVIFIWKQRTELDPPAFFETGTEADKEIWTSIKVLRGHLKDVYDLSWCPNSTFLISGSVDNTAMVWNVSKGRSISILDDHKNFVQGVAWDPKDRYLATLSSDRTCRVFDVNSKKIISRSSKVKTTSEQMARLYHDDTLQSFFRRLSFSPDGVLLIAPSGCMVKESGETINTTYVYTKYSFKQPAIIFPTKEYSVAVRCCPILFCLRNSSPVIPLPYRMVIAIATRSSVILYDTEQETPFAVISNIHYTRLTDLAWSSDGKILAVSSTDGFCSIITFSDNELGTHFIEESTMEKKDKVKETVKLDTIPTKTPLKKSAVTPNNKKATLIAIRRKPRNEYRTDSVADIDESANDGLPKLSVNTQTVSVDNLSKDTEDIKLVISDSVTTYILADTEKEPVAPECKPITPKAPRRVQLTTLSSPNVKKKNVTQ